MTFHYFFNSNGMIDDHLISPVLLNCDGECVFPSVSAVCAFISVGAEDGFKLVIGKFFVESVTALDPEDIIEFGVASSTYARIFILTYSYLDVFSLVLLFVLVWSDI